MELINANPFIRYARLHRTAGYADLRRCYDCRLFVFCDGSGTVNADGKDYSFSKNCALFLPPGTSYCFLPCGTRSTVFYAFDFDLTCDFAHISESRRTPVHRDFDESGILKTEAVRGFEEITFFTGVAQETDAILSEICTLYLRKPPLYTAKASGLLKAALCTLSCSKNEKSAELCDRVLEYIYENYHNPDLSNSAIAAHFGYHPYHLGALFKEKTGKTLRRCLIDFRLSVAENMLLTTDLSVSEISWKCGFSSVSHFIKSFGEQNGITPGEMRG